MKRFYSKFRIMLMTFTLGMASVFMINGSLQFSDEVPVDLPKIESGEILLVFPPDKNQLPCFARGDGSECGVVTKH